MHKIAPLLVAAALLTAGCASQTIKSEPATADSAATAIAAADASRAKAAAVGYEWRDTAGMIEDAKKAADAKEYDKAVKLAHQAEEQGKLAVMQHDHEEASYQQRMQ